MNRMLMLLALSLAGCGGGPAPLVDAEQAKQAVETSMNAWKEGKPPGPVASEPNAVEAIDSQWSSKRELAEFSLGTAEPGEGSYTFPVKLTLKNPPQEVDTRYVVIGGGPIFVYRDEDYQRMTTMENGPSTP
jgi:hypothetical protein